MSNYKTVMVGVTPAQRDKTIRAMRARAPTQLRLTKKNMEGGAYPLALTKMQKRKMKKNRLQGKGMVLNLTPKQLMESYRASEMMGSGWFKDIAKFVGNIAKPIAEKTLGSIVGDELAEDIVGAVGKLGSKGVDAIDKAITKDKGKGMGMYPLGSFGNGMYPLGSGYDSDDEMPCPCRQCMCDGSGVLSDTISRNIRMLKKKKSMRKRTPSGYGAYGSGPRPMDIGFQSGPRTLY